MAWIALDGGARVNSVTKSRHCTLPLLRPLSTELVRICWVFFAFIICWLMSVIVWNCLDCVKWNKWFWLTRFYIKTIFCITTIPSADINVSEGYGFVSDRYRVLQQGSPVSYHHYIIIPNSITVTIVYSPLSFLQAYSSIQITSFHKQGNHPDNYIEMFKLALSSSSSSSS